jgi:hypothetical protein
MIQVTISALRVFKIFNRASAMRWTKMLPIMRLYVNRPSFVFEMQGGVPYIVNKRLMLMRCRLE